MDHQVIERQPLNVGKERRGAARAPVIKSAQLIIGNNESLYNCLILDESESGVLVDLGLVMTVPEEVTIHFTDGATYRARCRWSRGTRTGLQFEGSQVVSVAAAARMQKLAEVLAAHGLAAAMRLLRAARFFDNAELRRAAEETEAATARFEAILAGQPPMSGN